MSWRLCSKTVHRSCKEKMQVVFLPFCSVVAWLLIVVFNVSYLHLKSFFFAFKSWCFNPKQQLQWHTLPTRCQGWVRKTHQSKTSTYIFTKVEMFFLLFDTLKIFNFQNIDTQFGHQAKLAWNQSLFKDA